MTTSILKYMYNKNAKQVSKDFVFYDGIHLLYLLLKSLGTTI